MDKNFKMGPWAGKNFEKWDLKGVEPAPVPSLRGDSPGKASRSKLWLESKNSITYEHRV